MNGPMREVKFSQTHRRTHMRRHVVVSQFDDTEKRAHLTVDAGLAWRYIVQTENHTEWTASRRVDVGRDASDDEVAQAVARHLASPGWDRDAAT